MRGLLMKDIQLLKAQKQFFLMVIGIALVISITGDGQELFILPYGTLCIAMFTLNSIAYDEYGNGAPYLFTMPIERKSYVKEKYLYGVLLSTTAMGIMSFLGIAVGWYRHRLGEPNSFVSLALLDLVVAIAFLAVTIPIRLKFGTEKNNSVLWGLCGVLIALGISIVKLLEKWDINLNSVFASWMRSLPGWILDHAEVWILLLMILFCVLAVLISYRISLRIVNRKEY